MELTNEVVEVRSTPELLTRPDGAIGPHYVEIPRVRGASVETFERIFAALEQPVILEEFANVAQWPAVRDWSIERFASTFADVEIYPRVNYPNPDDWWINPFETLSNDFPPFERMTFGEFFRRALNKDVEKSPIYWRNRGHNEEIAEKALTPFLSGALYETIVPQGAERHLELLIGSAGTKAGLHQDDRHNFLIHVAGSKRVMMVSPYFTRCVHPFPGLPEKSPVNLDRYEERYPSLAEATVLVGTIGPGEVLFIPRGWWHTLRAYEPTIMLGCFYGDRLTARDMAHMYRQLGVRYQIASAISYVRRFVRTSFNIIMSRDPVDGLPIWESPGSAAALSFWGRLAQVYHRIRPGDQGEPSVKNPFF